MHFVTFGYFAFVNYKTKHLAVAQEIWAALPRHPITHENVSDFFACRAWSRMWSTFAYLIYLLTLGITVAKKKNINCSSKYFKSFTDQM